MGLCVNLEYNTVKIATSKDSVSLKMYSCVAVDSNLTFEDKIIALKLNYTAVS